MPTQQGLKVHANQCSAGNTHITPIIRRISIIPVLAKGFRREECCTRDKFCCHCVTSAFNIKDIAIACALHAYKIVRPLASLRVVI